MVGSNVGSCFFPPGCHGYKQTRPTVSPDTWQAYDVHIATNPGFGSFVGSLPIEDHCRVKSL